MEEKDRIWNEQQIVKLGWKLGVLGLFLYVCTVGLWYSTSIWMLFALGALGAIFLNGLADKVKSACNISYRKSLLLTVVSVLLCAALAGRFAGGKFLDQTRLLFDNIPTATQVKETVREAPMGSPLVRYIDGEMGGSEKRNILANLIDEVVNMASMSLGAVGSVLLVGFVTLYLASEPAKYRNGFLKLFKTSRREQADRVLGRLERRLRSWIHGQICAMATLAVLTSAALWILGIPMFLPLGLFTGLVAFVPYIGPIMSVVPAALVAIPNGGLDTVAAVFGIYLGIQLVESYLVTPLFHREFASLPPVLTLLFQGTMGLLFGLLGILLAAPTVAVVMVLVQELWIKRNEG
jgi:predicted PurR-regulated permease PerM